MRQRINPGPDIFLDIANVKKLIGEVSLDKLVSAVAWIGHQRQAGRQTATLDHSTIQDGGDLI